MTYIVWRYHWKKIILAAVILIVIVATIAVVFTVPVSWREI